MTSVQTIFARPTVAPSQLATPKRSEGGWLGVQVRILSRIFTDVIGSRPPERSEGGRIEGPSLDTACATKKHPECSRGGLLGMTILPLLTILTILPILTLLTLLTHGFFLQI